VNLGSGCPCRNDGVDKISAKVETKLHHYHWALTFSRMVGCK
jgi:hypothetical protein